jgi:short-subunit dehydrogenase
VKSSRARARHGAGRNETALITGASSGIGEALARRFAQGGFNVVLVARRADRLEGLADHIAKTYPVKAWVAAADLAQPEAARKLATSMKRARRSIDVLVNNAGILEHGAFVSIPAARHQQLIDLNIGALTAMLAEFVPPMVARGGGRVLNVASIAAFQPVPSLATYAATKAYVLSLTESLAEELAGSGVTVTALCPGITATDMLDNATRGSRELTKLPRLIVGDADSVAEDGYQACLRGELICVSGVLNQAVTLTSRATPRWLVRRLTGAMSRRLRKS